MCDQKATANPWINIPNTLMHSFNRTFIMRSYGASRLSAYEFRLVVDAHKAWKAFYGVASTKTNPPFQTIQRRQINACRQGTTLSKHTRPAITEILDALEQRLKHKHPAPSSRPDTAKCSSVRKTNTVCRAPPNLGVPLSYGSGIWSMCGPTFGLRSQTLICVFVCVCVNCTVIILLLKETRMSDVVC